MSHTELITSTQVETLSQQTLDAENEVNVLKRKNAASLRELTRELQSTKRQLDDLIQSTSMGSQVQSVSPSGGHMSRSSRTSSNLSLNRMDEQQQQTRSPNGGSGVSLVPQTAPSLQPQPQRLPPTLSLPANAEANGKLNDVREFKKVFFS